jgi:hypothetical protein
MALPKENYKLGACGQETTDTSGINYIKQAARDAALRRGVERLRTNVAEIANHTGSPISKRAHDNFRRWLDALLRAGEETTDG